MIKKFGLFLLYFPLFLFFLSCNKKVNVKLQEKPKNASQAVNVTIFVHGTHSKFVNYVFKKFASVPNKIVHYNTLDSYHYTQSIVNNLENSSKEEFPSEHFYAYGWSGELSFKVREEAGKKLYFEIKKLIESYRNKNSEPKITIITHSHGGNVALNLTHSVEPNANFKIDRLILLACPVQKATKDFVKHPIFNKVYNVFSKMDLIQIADPQGLQTKDKRTPLFSERVFESHSNLKQAKIKVNGRALLHIEFIFGRFLRRLPQIINEMDRIDSNHVYLVKAYKDKCYSIVVKPKKHSRNL